MRETGLDLTLPVVLGGGQFVADDPAAAAAVLDVYLAAGGRVIDTARIYGTSEEAIGGWLRAHGEVPVQLVTKGAHPDPADWLPRLSRAEVLRDARTSIGLLGRPADLYLLHRDDPLTAVDDVADTLHTVVEEGLATSVGVSNWGLDRVRALRPALAARGLALGALSDHIGLALPSGEPDWALQVSLDARALEWIEANGVLDLAWSSQSSGYFAGAHHGTQFAGPENERRRALLDRVAGEHDVRPDALLARWSATLSPAVVPVVSSRSPERLGRVLADTQDAALDPAVDALIAAVDPTGALGRGLIAPGAVW